jgi:biopolymer transport protein ExbB/TolQ
MEVVDMSPLGLFLNAGIVSKCVMIVLLLASVWTWVLIIDGLYVAIQIDKSLKKALKDNNVGVLWPIIDDFQKARKYLINDETSRQKRQRIREYTKNSIQRFMSDAKGELSNLAIVSSVGPFIGLFGTVWGIISSFAGIAETQETSLAVVAPGIAEALAATAYGLGAAIPAAIAYNRIGATFAKLNQEINDYMSLYASNRKTY